MKSDQGKQPRTHDANVQRPRFYRAFLCVFLVMPLVFGVALTQERFFHIWYLRAAHGYEFLGDVELTNEKGQSVEVAIFFHDTMPSFIPNGPELWIYQRSWGVLHGPVLIDNIGRGWITKVRIVETIDRRKVIACTHESHFGSRDDFYLEFRDGAIRIMEKPDALETATAVRVRSQ